MLDRQRSTKEVLLITYSAVASHAINNTSFVDLCLSCIEASYHLLSSIYANIIIEPKWTKPHKLEFDSLCAYLFRFSQCSAVIGWLHGCEVIYHTDVTHDILYCSTATFGHPVIEHPRLRLHSISCHISSGDYLSFVYSVNRWPTTYIRTFRTILVYFDFGVCLTPRLLFRQKEP